MRRLSPLAVCLFLLAFATFVSPVSVTAQGTSVSEPDTSVAGNVKVAEIMKNREGRGVMADDTPLTLATEAVKEFKVRDGFQIELIANEPDVTQPLFLSWDSRGRLWVVQYRQYQYPAGLKVIRFDQHLRAVFDRVPDPPPHGTKGADKITVYEDTNGDGVYDTHNDVITGLNITSSVQVGNGSIWVVNPPYLLRYPDADQNGTPDGDPEVHLSGFGLQDTHAVANSLVWGPDGWLYGATGSTTVSDVSSEVTKGVRFQGQSIWRYHPTRKVFEIYAEGGGNNFSLEIDSKGRVFAGTNGGDTRGYYFPQGSYFVKNWGKHGPLTNPYAFGFFSQMKFEGDARRFPQAFCIYEGGVFPQEHDGSIIAPNSLHNLVWISKRFPDGSSYRTVDGPNLLETSDRWFRPVYAGVGPDGAVYLADWSDTRLSHVSPVDDWHKDSGRIFRIIPNGTKPVYREGDLSKLSSNELIEKFSHTNKWVRRRAMLELGWRDDKSVVDELLVKVDQGSLESLWALNLMSEMNHQRAGRWLDNADAGIRRWTVRLLGDRHEGHPKLVDLIGDEDVQVRSQLASSAKRLPPADAMPLIAGLLQQSQDIDDPHLPLLSWWALEGQADHWEVVKSMLADTKLWKAPIFRKYIASRLMQRYAAAGSPEDLAHCAELLQLASDDEIQKELITGLNRAFQGRSLPPLPPSLSGALAEYQSKMGDSGIVLGIRQGSKESVGKGIAVLKDRSADLGIQIAIAKSFGEVDVPQAIPVLVSLAIGNGTSEAALQRVAMQSLTSYNEPSIPKALVAAFAGRISSEHGLRPTACRTLASRPEWAKVLLGELAQWRIERSLVPADVVQQLRTYQDPEVVALVEKVFGKSLAASGPELAAEYKRIRTLLAAKQGDGKAGKVLFTNRCANCHQLFGEGKKVGPPLDGYERGNVTFWLNGIIDPALEIREGFQSYLILTDDGRALNGMIAAQDPQTVTLRNADNQLSVISREEIEELRALPTSLMPSDVLKDMTDNEIRNLFAYLSIGAK